jgi:hypothetical protein
MQITLRKWTKVIVVLLAGAYLFAGAASLMHFHTDGADYNNCPLCYHYQNYHFQELPAQSSVIEVLLSQTFTLSEPVVRYTKAVFHSDPSRAPPRLKFV